MAILSGEASLPLSRYRITDTLNMNDLFQMAMQAFVDGRIKEADRLCKAILKTQPKAHPALHLLALTEKRRGKHKLAIKTFNKALRLAPATEMYWNNLGETYREIGKTSDAIECYRKAINLRPAYAEAFSNWGSALIMTGHHAEAKEKLKRALEINPEMGNALYNLGVVNTETGHSDQAQRAYEQLLDSDPYNADALVNLSCLRQEAGQIDAARSGYLRALKMTPSHFQAHLNFGNLLYGEQAFAQAIKHFNQAIKLEPRNFDAWFGLGLSLNKSGDTREACIALKRAWEINKESAEVLLSWADAALKAGNDKEAMRLLDHYRNAIGEDAPLHGQLARIHFALGRMDSAASEARRCLALDPQSVKTYRVLVQSAHLGPRDSDITKMLELYSGDALSEEHRTHLVFSLAWAMDKIGNPNAAFEYLTEGNRRRARASDYERQAKREIKLQRLESIFTPEFISKRLTWGDQDQMPVFVVGLPRSGKTLIETLLCRQPRIMPAGELPKFIDIVNDRLTQQQLGTFPMGVPGMAEAHFKQVGRSYVEHLRCHFKGAQRVINTLPGNAFRIGMIKLCLPNAKVIWTDRDLRDTCFEMYRKDFEVGHEFTNDLTILGKYAAQFNRLMAYWNRLLPGFVHRVEFEKLLSDPEQQMGELIRFIGMNSTDEITESARPESTAAFDFRGLPAPEQAIGVWRPYEKHLSPLLEALVEV